MTHPSCPPNQRPMLRSPAATWRGPGDPWTGQGSLNPSGQWEGGVGEGTWIFLFMIKWVRQAPRAGLGEKSGFWKWGEAGQALGEQEKEPRARLGADEAEPCSGQQLWPRPGVVVGCIPQRQAWRLEAARGLRWMGWEGSLFGPGYPRTPNTPS